MQIHEITLSEQQKNWKDYAHGIADYFLSKNPNYRSVLTPYNKRPTTSAPVKKDLPVPKKEPVATQEYQPITIGTQTFINKGNGYYDSKTGKPMPSSLLKALPK